jgi:pimeloyl-ACP methyl ester carboxylesterase
MLVKNIVLLHGWAASCKKLEPLARELEKLGWKVYLPKLPGFDAKDPDFAWGVGQYAHYVLTKSKEFFKGQAYFIFGHSFGGRITLKIAFSNQQELLSGIVLCSTAGLSRGNFLKVFVFKVLSKFAKVFLSFSTNSSWWSKIFYKLAREHDYENAQGIMKEVFKKVINEDLKPLVSKVKFPTLVLWGKEDITTKIGDAYFIKKELPKSTLIVFDKEGHRLPYNKPAEIAKEIDRWQETLA